MPVVPQLLEGWQFKSSLGKVSIEAIFKKQTKIKLGVWLK
jgi:hypothetical protein